MAPPLGRLLVKRGGHSITRQIPKPIVIIDTREKTPFTFGNHRNWIAGTVRYKLKAGDYSMEGMDNLLVLERKSLTDLITTLMHCRTTFIKECERLAGYRWRAILVEASYEDIKSPYHEELCTLASPNAVSGSLDAVEARFSIQVIYTSQNRALAEEKAASWLSKYFTYWHLQKAGLGRILQEGDL